MKTGRRVFLGALGGAAASFPFYAARSQNIGKEHPIFRVQTSWGENTVGYELFKNFCDSTIERTQGELALKPYPAGAVRNDLQLYDALKIGALEGVNTFSVYWASRLPAGVFMSSYPGGLSAVSHWDTMVGAYGGKAVLLRIYKKLGLHFVGYVHHGINLLHSRRPLKSLNDFKDLKVRVPGNLIGDSFRVIGARPLLLPGSSIVEALDAGTIDAAEFVGAGVNSNVGLHGAANYVVMGPHSSPGLSQPNDIMDFAILATEWQKLKPSVRSLFTDLVNSYSHNHYVQVQSANRAGWQKMSDDGVKISRLSETDMKKFRRALLPLWFDYANKDEDAKKLFSIHLKTMRSEEINLLSEDDIEGYQLS